MPGVPSSGKPRESQKKFRDRVGIVEGTCGYRARGVSIRGTYVLLRNPVYNNNVAKCSSTHRVDYPEVKVQVRGT